MEARIYPTDESFESRCNRYREMFRRFEENDMSLEERRNAINRFSCGLEPFK